MWLPLHEWLCKARNVVVPAAHELDPAPPAGPNFTLLNRTPRSRPGSRRPIRLFVNRYVALRVRVVLVVSRLCTRIRCATLIRVLIRLTLRRIREIGSLTDPRRLNRLCPLSILVKHLVKSFMTVAWASTSLLPPELALLGLLKLKAFRAVVLVRVLTRRLRKRVVVRLSALVRKLGRVRHLVSPALNNGLGSLMLTSFSRRVRLPQLRMITERRQWLNSSRRYRITLGSNMLT